MAEEPQQVLHTEHHREGNLRHPQLIEPRPPDFGHRVQHDDTDADQNGGKQPQVKALRSATATKKDIEQLFPNGLHFNSSTPSVMAPTSEIRQCL